MGDIIYRPLIEDMTWSYSRITAFEQCPHGWYLRYIRRLPKDDRFYSSYGSFVHSLIERYYRGELSKEQLPVEFATKFATEVKGFRPSNNVVVKYINDGMNYFTNFEPYECDSFEVEKEIYFSIGGKRFVCYIDFVGFKDGKIFLVDHKSAELKEKSKRAKPTASDKKIDEILRQLYFYSAAIEQEYGKLPSKLCINSYRSGVFIEEEFDNEKFEDTKRWALERIEDIESVDEFFPFQDFFFCKNLCGLNNFCTYDIEAREERRHS